MQKHVEPIRMVALLGGASRQAVYQAVKRGQSAKHWLQTRVRNWLQPAVRRKGKVRRPLHDLHRYVGEVVTSGRVDVEHFMSWEARKGGRQFCEDREAFAKWLGHPEWKRYPVWHQFACWVEMLAHQLACLVQSAHCYRMWWSQFNKWLDKTWLPRNSPGAFYGRGPPGRKVLPPERSAYDVFLESELNKPYLTFGGLSDGGTLTPSDAAPDAYDAELEAAARRLYGEPERPRRPYEKWLLKPA